MGGGGRKQGRSKIEAYVVRVGKETYVTLRFLLREMWSVDLPAQTCAWHVPSDPVCALGTDGCYNLIIFFWTSFSK